MAPKKSGVPLIRMKRRADKEGQLALSTLVTKATHPDFLVPSFLLFPAACPPCGEQRAAGARPGEEAPGDRPWGPPLRTESGGIG